MSKLEHFVERLFARLDKRLGLPTSNQMRRDNTAWEYAQANTPALWDAEENPQALRGAMDMRRTDPAAALVFLRDSAEAGSAIAMNQVGEIYFWGDGVEVDQNEGETWFNRAYLAGSQRALLTYGKLLVRRGDLAKAEQVFKAGADAGWLPAIYWLAKIRLDISQDATAREHARFLLERAAAMGHPTARWRLGKDMTWGRFGLHRIPRGLSILVAYSWDMLSEEERKNRPIPTGETLH